MTKLADGTVIYPLVAIDEPDFDRYARDYVGKKFPEYEFKEILRYEKTSQGRAVLLSVRMTKREEATS